MGIPSANSTAAGSGKGTPKSSSHGSIIGIVIAAVVLVVIAVSAVLFFFCIRRRNDKRKEEKEKAAAAKEIEEAAEWVRQGFDKAELGAAADHARYEMAGSGVPGGRAEAEGRPLPAWVKEKADLAHYTGMHELTGGDVAIAELGDRKRLLHEMYDPSAAPVELPADVPRELPGSIPSPRSPRSAPSFHTALASPPVRSGPSSPVSSPSSRPSPIDRRMGRTPQSRSSTLNSRPFAPSPTSQSGPSSPTDRSMASSPRSPSTFSPISPVGDRGSESRSPTEQIPLVPMSQGLSQPTPSPGDTLRGSQRHRQSPLISSLRAEDSRRRRRNEF